MLEEAFAAINNVALDANPADVADPSQPDGKRKDCSRARVVAAGAVEATCKALATHKSRRHFGVLESICRALATLLFSDPVAKLRATQLGAGEMILEMVELGTDDGVQKRKGPLKREPVKLERPELLAQALRALSTLVANVVEMQENGVRVQRRPVQAMVCEKGGIKVIMDLLKKFRENEAVQWQALACMANIMAQNTDRNKEEAERQGLIARCADALLLFKESKTIQAEGLRCLMNACNSSVQNEDRAVSKGALERAVVAMQTFPDVPEVNEMAARLVLCLVWTRMSNRAMAIRAGADTQLQIVKTKYLEQKERNNVADWAAAALSKIASSAA